MIPVPSNTRVWLTSGDEQEQIFGSLDRLTTNVQAHVDALTLTDAQKAQATRNEITRMQQLLLEAGFYQSEQSQSPHNPVFRFICNALRQH
ncbi:hypothetical protein [Roseobacter sp.]|uniref:hypothetical protein n=1 Tax=Roseobacter sp. TaxID=1907202 RepID=UPI00385A799E